MNTSKPKQYEQGWVEFYKLRFKVTPDVLIPRPESELLVDGVLDYVETINDNRYTIIDLGTGSGAIAISLAKNLASHLEGGRLKIIATDVSKEALIVAQQNAKLHGVLDQIEFIESDLLTDIPTHRLTDSLILVTNLPYIPSERIAYLDSSVKDFEPHLALDGGEDGFELYRKLFKQIASSSFDKLRTPRNDVIKLLIGEIDYTHGDLAVQEGLKYFPKAQVEVKKDLAHLQRILTIKFI